MSQKMVVRKHATYRPQTPQSRPEARSHATLTQTPAIAASPGPRHTRPSMAASIPRTDRALPRLHHARAALTTLCPAAILICALSNGFVGLLLGLSTLLAHTFRQHVGTTAFPLLLCGMFLILTRGQVKIQTYMRVRREVGLVTGHWTDHGLMAMYIWVLFLATAIVATLLAWGAAMWMGYLFS